MPPIQPSPRFDKARTLTLLTERARLGHPLTHGGAHCCPFVRPSLAFGFVNASCVQVKDLGSGNFGVARLEREVATGELVAVKYLPRGPSVRTLHHGLTSCCFGQLGTHALHRDAHRWTRTWHASWCATVCCATTTSSCSRRRVCFGARGRADGAVEPVCGSPLTLCGCAHLGAADAVTLGYRDGVRCR